LRADGRAPPHRPAHPLPRRSAPRTGPADRQRLPHHRLRGRAGALPDGAAAEALAAARRGRHGPLLRLRGARGAREPARARGRGAAGSDAPGELDGALVTLGRVRVPARLPARRRGLGPAAGHARGAADGTGGAAAREVRLRAGLRARQAPRMGGHPAARHPRSPRPAMVIGDTDLHLFNEGSHLRLWEKLGAHPGTSGGRSGTHFAVWAPAAERVSVVGDWNAWNRDVAPLARRGESGIWEGFVPGVERGARYKYHVASRYAGYRVDKADPLAFLAETP